jgi:GrpB-like predicted nucleotidyltransferase (UPF0157 family)
VNKFIPRAIITHTSYIQITIIVDFIVVSRIPRPITIVPYNPSWPVFYEEEKSRILEAIGEIVVDIDHVGSTAVPGLSAKPIIDIMAGLRGPSDAEACLPPLVELGYDDVTPEPEEDDWFYCWGRAFTASGITST